MILIANCSCRLSVSYTENVGLSYKIDLNINTVFVYHPKTDNNLEDIMQRIYLGYSGLGAMQ